MNGIVLGVPAIALRFALVMESVLLRTFVIVQVITLDQNAQLLPAIQYLVTAHLFAPVMESVLVQIHVFVMLELSYLTVY